MRGNPPGELLKRWNDWSAGVGHLVDDGRTPGMLSASGLLGLRGELRPAPASTAVTVDTDPGDHYQHYFEEPVTAGKTPQFDAGSNGSASNANTLTVSHVVADNDNRLMVVGVIIDATTSIAGRVTVSYNGVNLTLQSPGTMEVGSTTSLLATALAAPSVGTANIVVTITGAAVTTVVLIGSSWYDVDQTGAGGNVKTATAASTGPATVDITSKSSEVVLDIAACTDNDQTMTVGASQTEVSGTGGVQKDDVRLGSSREAGVATTTMSWTLGASTTWRTWGIALFGVHPGPSYLYAQRGKRSGSSSTVKVNKISLSNTDFGNLETGEHDLTPLTVPGQPVRYVDFWWFPMGDDQKARRLQTIGAGAVSNDTLDATATQLGADHFTNLGNQIAATLEHSSNDAGGIRVLKVDGDIGTEADWGSPFQTGDRKERAGGVRSLGDLSFVLNIEGLYSFTSKGRARLIFEDFRAWRHVFDNIPITPYKGGLALSHPTGLLFYEPGRLPVNIGLNAELAGSSLVPSGPPELRGGRYHGFAVAGDFLWVIYQPTTSSTTVNVMVGYPREDSPLDMVWQQIGTSTLQDIDHMLGCFVSVSSKPVSAGFVTPTLWYGSGDDIEYVVLGTTASPFRTRVDTHKVTAAADAYMSELRFTEAVDLTGIVIHTSGDMVAGDEFQVSLLANGAGDDIDVGPPAKGLGVRHVRTVDRHNVTSLVLHVNWVATSTANRVPPTIQGIELFGVPSVGGSE